MRSILLIAALSMSACVTLSPEEIAMRKKVEKEYVNNPGSGVTKIGLRNDLGQKDMYFRASYGMEMRLTKNGSVNAKTCESYASYKTGMVKWLEPCEAALAEPDLTEHDHVATLYNRGLIFMKMDDTRAAQNSFNMALERDSGFAPGYLAKAMMAANDHDYEKAIELANQAISLDLANPHAAYNVIGYAQEGQFEFDKARRAYRQALALRPGASHVRRNLERVNRLWPEKPARSFVSDI